MKKCGNPLWYFNTLLVAWLALVLAGCASKGNTQSASQAGTRGVLSAPAEKWQIFEPNTLKAQPSAHGQLIFLREDNALDGSAVNIFLDGEYFTSLLPGGYKQSPACAGIRRFTAHFTNVDSGYREKEVEGQNFIVIPGQPNYFRLVKGIQGNPVLVSISQQDGANVASKLKAQSHSVPRVGKLYNCAVVPINS